MALRGISSKPDTNVVVDVKKEEVVEAKPITKSVEPTIEKVEEVIEDSIQNEIDSKTESTLEKESRKISKITKSKSPRGN